MPGRAATDELELADIGGGESPGGGLGGDGDGRGAAPPRIPQHTYFTGVVLALASILMFFMALTSAFIVRKGLSDDWAPFPFPPALWLNTALLIASSVTIERARRALDSEPGVVFQRWWAITTVLGFSFLVGQVFAWQQLVAEGVYLATNPSSSFFFLLTGAHGAHLLGGLLALVYVGFRGELARASRQTAATAAAIYWHFMDALWVFLFLLLLLGR